MGAPLPPDSRGQPGRRQHAAPKFEWPSGGSTGPISRCVATAPPAAAGAWATSPVDSFICAEARGGWPVARALGRPPHADSPRDVRPHRPAADARRGRGLSRRQVARCLRAAGRSAAGLARLRRAVGPALARRGPLQRDARLRVRLRPVPRLAVSRLRHPGVQRRPALRPVRDRAPGGRPRARSRARAAGRLQ